ncbi:hypothetical protein COOONC_17296 [Cooperia oncophora]
MHETDHAGCKKKVREFIERLPETEKGIEQSGSHFDNVIAKVKEYFGLLPEEKKNELKANFKAMHESKNIGELKKKITELEEDHEERRQTVEHVREVCYGVWKLEEVQP